MGLFLDRITSLRDRPYFRGSYRRFPGVQVIVTTASPAEVIQASGYDPKKHGLVKPVMIGSSNDEFDPRDVRRVHAIRA